MKQKVPCLPGVRLDSFMHIYYSLIVTWGGGGALSSKNGREPGTEAGGGWEVNAAVEVRDRVNVKIDPVNVEDVFYEYPCKLH